MNADPNPGKINNQLNENISSTSVSLGKLINQLKNQSKTDGQSTSSKTSNSSDPKKLSKFKDLYSKLESGQVTSEAFRSQVLEEMKITPQFDKVLHDPHRSYKELVKTLDISRKPVSAEYFDSRKQGTVISSTALTTVKTQPKLKVNMDELNGKIKDYAQGFTSRSDFLGYLQEKNIPVSNDLEKHIREHEETKSVPFYNFGKSIYTSLSESDNVGTLIGSPNKKNPNSYRFVHKANMGKGNPETKEKMKEENLKRELDKLGGGVYLTHKKKLEPKVVHNGELTVWDPNCAEMQKSKTLSHLQHHDIFGWNGNDEAAAVSRKAAIVQKASMNSGDIIKWQSRE